MKITLGQFTRKALAFAVILLTHTACIRSTGRPKNVILLIGDGMGVEQVKAAGMYANGEAGSLSFEDFPYQAQMTTHSASHQITDSAAGGTAIATGVKVNNETISLAIPGDKTELKTLLEYSQERGKSTGLVTTTTITHATPAAFGAHEISRYNEAAIAKDYLTQTRPEVLFGGVAEGMTPTTAKEAGYKVITDASQMAAMDTENVTRVSGQFAEGHLPFEFDGLGSAPRLSEMTATALKILDNDPDGLFLVVEGGRIDHAGHQNNIERNVTETVEFAKAVQVAFDWAKGRKDTLIIVLSDHETGGLNVLENRGKGEFPLVSWSTPGHTADPVPVYGWGKNAHYIEGVIDNTEIFAIVTVTVE